jgi:LIM domain
MADAQSMASILPSIRCSDCGVDVELSMMGEHVCSKQSERKVPCLGLGPRINTGTTVAPFPQFGIAPKSSPEPAFDRPFASKTARAPPPPRLQTNVIGTQRMSGHSPMETDNPTGRPLVPPNELTPASSSRGSNGISPISTSSGRSPFRAPSRGMTMPSRARPPSPELSNLDCAFPPFPTKVSRSNTPVSDSRSQSSDNESSYVRAHAEPYNAPLPRRGSTSSSGTRKRSKTVGRGPDITQPPSTAGSGRRPSFGNVGARPGFKNAPPLPSPLSGVASGGTQPPPIEKELMPSSADRPTNTSPRDGKNPFQFPFGSPKNKFVDADLNAEEGQRVRQRVPNGNTSKKEEAEISTTENHGKSPLDAAKPTQQSLNATPRIDGPSYRTKRPPPIANTWVKELEVGGTTSPQNPRVSPSRSQTFPLPTGNNTAAERRPSEPSVTSQSSWPLVAVTDATPEKPPTQAPMSSTISFSERPHHSPSDSASSYATLNSVAQSTSSRSSHPLQEIEPEKTPATDSRHGEHEAYEAETLTPPKHPLLDHEVDSPTDPAFQNGRLTPVERLGLHHTQTTPELPAQTPIQPANNPEQDPKRRPMLRSKTTGSNKGQCRGCSKIIGANQKSVSSADGRLTGRYHKECFACTTCHNAFATADFYVLRDQPYCAQHYHTLNGSLCGSCGHGIEGQYLEATRSEAKGIEKFHAKCFTCVMCRVVLKHDYFAHHGRFFCERDIHRVAGPSNRPPNGRGPATTGLGPGGSSYLSPGNTMPRGKFPERRSTKLMIMS